MAIITRLTKPLGGRLRPAKYEVEPHPARVTATTRAPAALNQRLLFFKILYLDGERGACRNPGINKKTAKTRFYVPAILVRPEPAP
jgi:hypothetical protein